MDADVQQDVSVLAVVLGRAGSKGLPHKNVLPLAGQPMVAWTLDHALHSRCVTQVILSTDGAEIAAVGRDRGVTVIERPADLASDTATVDSAARHAVEHIERQTGRTFPIIVILYANVPLRPADLTDRAVSLLRASGGKSGGGMTSGGGADSVQSVCPVGKMHPYWMKKLGGATGDVLEPYVPNTVYRRQDLPPVYMLDGGIIAVTRRSLFTIVPGQPHAFLGTDRRAIVTQPGEVVDIDTPEDLAVAQALLSRRTEEAGHA